MTAFPLIIADELRDVKKIACNFKAGVGAGAGGTGAVRCGTGDGADTFAGAATATSCCVAIGFDVDTGTATFGVAGPGADGTEAITGFWSAGGGSYCAFLFCRNSQTKNKPSNATNAK